MVPRNLCVPPSVRRTWDILLERWDQESELRLPRRTARSRRPWAQNARSLPGNGVEELPCHREPASDPGPHLWSWRPSFAFRALSQRHYVRQLRRSHRLRDHPKLRTIGSAGRAFLQPPPCHHQRILNDRPHLPGWGAPTEQNARPQQCLTRTGRGTRPTSPASQSSLQRSHRVGPPSAP